MPDFDPASARAWLERVRWDQHAGAGGGSHHLRAALDVIDAQAKRIAELEAYIRKLAGEEQLCRTKDGRRWTSEPTLQAVEARRVLESQ